MSWSIEQEGNVFHISRDDGEARTFNVLSSGKPDKKLWFLNAEIVDLALDLFGGDEGDNLARMEAAWAHLRKLKHPSTTQHAAGSKEDREARAAAQTAKDLIDPEAIEAHRKFAWIAYYADNYTDENWERYQAISNGREEPPDDWPEGLDARSYITKANRDEAFSSFEGSPGDDVEPEPKLNAPKSEMHLMLEAATAQADQKRRKREAPGDAA